ncbi:MAG: ABC transporter substrate-binding protein [Caldilineaceae bacterium]|nr:ABC transporter substrate-binding protein [Caldilineaceae bacterium]
MISRMARPWAVMRVSRMRMLMLLLVIAVLTGCSAPAAAPTPGAAPAQPAAEAPTVVPPEAAASAGHEAPMLAEKVAAGELPPLEERLPANPLVVDVVERIGTYGGTWNMALRGGSDNALFVRTIGYDYLVRWDPEWKEVIPNIAESFEANETATEFTFKLREGMKWSDGAPFTADDILFWYEDVLMDADLTPVIPTWLVSGDEPVVVEKVDDLTVTFRFAAPNGLFLYFLASPTGDQPTRYPRHYLEQFLPKYNEAGIDALIAEAQATDWIHLFQLKGGGVPSTPYNALWYNADLPTLYAWDIEVPYIGGQQVVAERNPYYWKVDPEGNQLPYIDEVSYEVGEDVEVLVLKALNGELDMQERHISSLANKAVFTDNMDKGNYHFFETRFADNNVMSIALNLNHKDPVLREIFQSKDFRIGLSHAINRQEIIDVVLVGQGEPWQPAPQPGSPFYNERLAKQYTEFDVDLANQHLDAAGLTERDAEGFRLRPDGSRLTFTVEVISVKPDWIDMMELIEGYWEAVGVDVNISTVDRSLGYAHRDAVEYDALAWWTDGGAGLDTILDPYLYFPEHPDSAFAVAWAYWYMGDTRGEEPSEAAKRQMELYDQLKSAADPQVQVDLMNQLLEISADEFYVMGISQRAPGYGIVKNNFHNVPDSFPHAYNYPAPAPTNPEQYYIEGE